MADRLRRAVENKEIVDRAAGKKMGGVTISVGVTEYREGEDVNSLIERADAVLYEAKKSGRNRVCAVPEISS